jgi:hypothetical protein
LHTLYIFMGHGLGSALDVAHLSTALTTSLKLFEAISRATDQSRSFSSVEQRSAATALLVTTPMADASTQVDKAKVILRLALLATVAHIQIYSFCCIDLRAVDDSSQKRHVDADRSINYQSQSYTLNMRIWYTLALLRSRPRSGGR